ncbi:PREDICTED: uncharacterized protein LOC105531519 [Mandrillus leucophaeus]|uniref:uncharacterized protein LOC105531519 n=1 Tax=Mandrillus leucophaeus TaxID=9568 RepID=UPI0005F4B02C|nr:PREDICTED: uncharacterized protein LOC105531519 [Mandrillus leucophaeus]
MLRAPAGRSWPGSLALKIGDCGSAPPMGPWGKLGFCLTARVDPDGDASPRRGRRLSDDQTLQDSAFPFGVFLQPPPSLPGDARRPRWSLKCSPEPKETWPRPWGPLQKSPCACARRACRPLPSHPGGLFSSLTEVGSLLEAPTCLFGKTPRLAQALLAGPFLTGSTVPLGLTTSPSPWAASSPPCLGPQRHHFHSTQACRVKTNSNSWDRQTGRCKISKAFWAKKPLFTQNQILKEH